MFLPISAGFLLQHLIHVMIERLLKMVAEAIGILLLLSGQVDQEPADNPLVHLPLILHSTYLSIIIRIITNEPSYEVQLAL